MVEQCGKRELRGAQRPRVAEVKKTVGRAGGEEGSSH